MHWFVPIALLLCSTSSETQSSHAPLIQFLQNYVGQDEADKDARFAAAFVDLKNDGTKEAIVYLSSSSWCGTGSCTLLIMTPETNSYTLISKIPAVRPPIKILATITKGWHDISAFVVGGGILSSYDAKISFDGSSYSDHASISPAHRMHGKSKGKVVIPVNAKKEPLFK